MDISLFIATMLAGAAYVILPGPAFLALLGIGAAQGRAAGAGFVIGHLAGDLVWASLAITAIVGSASLGSLVFDLLGLICGCYLGWLGWKALRAKPTAEGGLDNAVRHPLRRGLAFGLTNPKGYPVSVAMFTALLASHAQELGWSLFPQLLAAAFVGFVLADIVLVALIGSSPVRRIYTRHQLAITRASGLLFIGFGLQALWQSAGSLLFRRG